MSMLLKVTYLHIFTAIVIFGVYGFWIFGVVGVEYFTGPEALVRTGKSIAVLIVCGYAFEILLTIAMAFFNITVLKENPTIDERDKKIVYRSIYLSHHVLCTGLFVSVGALALGVSVFWVFNVIVFGFFLSVVAELSTKLFYYHREA